MSTEREVSPGWTLEDALFYLPALQFERQKQALPEEMDSRARKRFFLEWEEELIGIAKSVGTISLCGTNAYIKGRYDTGLQIAAGVSYCEGELVGYFAIPKKREGVPKIDTVLAVAVVEERSVPHFPDGYVLTAPILESDIEIL